ncbi:unnamed protein product, partial [Ceratitis capitata]
MKCVSQANTPSQQLEVEIQNRRFVVRINGYSYDSYNLYNEIPQGSPLSIVLFVIGFDEIGSITDKYK